MSDAGSPAPVEYRAGACERCGRRMHVPVDYDGPVVCSDHAPSDNRPTPDPTGEGLAIVVTTGAPPVQLLACAECGVLLWDVEAHWTDAHSHRLQALRAIAARG